MAEVIRNLARGKVLLVVNKVDDANREGLIWEALSLGLGDPLPISALHGRGAGDMLDRLVEVLPQPEVVRGAGRRRTTTGPRRSGCSRWRWSAGRTWGSRRCSTGSSARTEPWCTTCPAPPATRSTPIVETDEGPIRFVDTAGMRRKAKIDEATEYYSLVRALQAVDKADVALLIIDSHGRASPPRTSGWPSASTPPAARWWCSSTSTSCSPTPRRGPTSTTRSSERLRFIGEAPVLKISALTGKGVQQADARAVAEHRGLPPAGADPARQRGDPRRPAGPARPARRQGALRHPGGHRPAHLHALRQPRGARRPTSATSSAACGRASTSAPPRSRCASASAADAVSGVAIDLTSAAKRSSSSSVVT